MNNRITASNWKLGEKLDLLCDGVWKTVSVCGRISDGINVVDEKARAEFYSEARLRRLFADGALKRVKLKQNLPETVQKRIEASLCALPASQRAHARLASAYIMEFVRRGEKGRATRVHLEQIIADVAAEYQDSQPPCWRTLSDKLKHVKDGYVDIREVMGGRELRGNRSERFGAFEPVMKEIIKENILVPVPQTTVCVHALLKDRLKTWNALQEPQNRVERELGLRTVQRRMSKISDYEKVLAWEGSKEAARRFKPVGKAPPARFAMDVVEIDHTVADVFAVHPRTRKLIGRPILTVAVDRYSRMVVGFHIGFEEASYKTVMLCLRQAICPKDNLLEANGIDVDAWGCHGRMQTIVMDNGREFRGAELDDALAQLFVDKRYCRTATGSDKGTVERFLKTPAKAFFHTLPGTTFSTARDKGDRDTEATACLTVADIRRLFLRWLVLEYARSEHRGINDAPMAKFAESTERHPLALLDDVADLDVLLLPAATRTLQVQGIAMFGVYYGSRDKRLEALLVDPQRPNECIVKYDPNDIGYIWLLDWRTQRYVKLACPTDSGFEGLTEREFNVDRELALSKKRDRKALYGADLDAARVERVRNVKALIDEGKAKGRAIGRLGGADPESPLSKKDISASAGKPAARPNVARPQLLPKPRSGSRVSFTFNPQ